MTVRDRKGVCHRPPSALPLKDERRFFSLRWERHNALNHTQFAGVDTTARFDPLGKQVNAKCGQVISARAAYHAGFFAIYVLVEKDRSLAVTAHEERFSFR